MLNYVSARSYVRSGVGAYRGSKITLTPSSYQIHSKTEILYPIMFMFLNYSQEYFQLKLADRKEYSARKKYSYKKISANLKPAFSSERFTCLFSTEHFLKLNLKHDLQNQHEGLHRSRNL